MSQPLKPGDASRNERKLLTSQPFTQGAVRALSPGVEAPADLSREKVRSGLCDPATAPATSPDPTNGKKSPRSAAKKRRRSPERKAKKNKNKRPKSKSPRHLSSRGHKKERQEGSPVCRQADAHQPHSSHSNRGPCSATSITNNKSQGKMSRNTGSKPSRPMTSEPNFLDEMAVPDDSAVVPRQCGNPLKAVDCKAPQTRPTPSAAQVHSDDAAKAAPSIRSRTTPSGNLKTSTSKIHAPRACFGEQTLQELIESGPSYPTCGAGTGPPVSELRSPQETTANRTHDRTFETGQILLPLENTSTMQCLSWVDAADSLEMQLSGGKPWKLAQEYIYYETRRRNRSSCSSLEDTTQRLQTTGSASALAVAGMWPAQLQHAENEAKITPTGEATCLKSPEPTDNRASCHPESQEEADHEKEQPGVSTPPRSSESTKNSPAQCAASMLLVTLVAIAGIAMFLLMIHLASSGHQRRRGLLSPTDTIEDRICGDRISCRSAVAAVAALANFTADPCSDFHAYACGGLTPGKFEGPSYGAEIERRLVAAIHSRLSSALKTPSLCAQHEHEMARFYASCRRFAEERPPRSPPAGHVVLKQAGIDGVAWTRARTHQDLLIDVVTTCIRTGLSSVISVTLSSQSALGYDQGRPRNSEGQFLVEAGTTIRNSLKNQRDISLLPIVKNTIDSMGLSGLELGKSEYSDILNLDKSLEQIRSGSNDPSSPLRTPGLVELVAVKNLPALVPGFSWLDAFRKSLPGDSWHILSEDMITSARDLDIVQGMTYMLLEHRISRVARYLLLLAVLQVTRYAHLLPSSTGVADEVTLFCVRVVEERFPVLFAAWLSQTLVTPEARRYLDDMVAALKLHSLRRPLVSETLGLNSTDIVFFQVKAAGIPNDVPTACSRSIQVVYTDDLFLNIILASREKPRRFEDLTHFRSYALENLRVSPDGALLVPPRYLAGELMVAASQPVLDYSTVGVRLLLELAHMLVARTQNDPVKLRAYEQCVRDQASENMAGEITEKALRDMMFTPWALDVAFEAAIRGLDDSKQSSQLGYNGDPRKQLFFQRFCQMSCGDSNAAKACTFAVLHSREFAKTFDCPRTPKLQC